MLARDLQKLHKGERYARTTNEVIDQMDDIIASSRPDVSRLAYFASLHRKVTIRVKEYIRDGKFEDGDRMERWDVVLANRYLEALSDYLQRRPTYACWEVAFQYAERRKLIIMQHLLLGMNAHINWWI